MIFFWGLRDTETIDSHLKLFTSSISDIIMILNSALSHRI